LLRANATAPRPPPWLLPLGEWAEGNALRGRGAAEGCDVAPLTPGTAVASGGASAAVVANANVTAPPPRRLRFLHHYRTEPGPSPGHAGELNAAPSLAGRFAACTAAWGAAPNVLSVHFWSIGNTLGTIDHIQQQLAPAAPAAPAGSARR